MNNSNDNRIKALMAWSSGKDSAWALHVARQRKDIEITGLLTTVTKDYARVSMHSSREELLEKQAEAAGMPLVKVYIPAKCSNEVYEAEIEKALQKAKEEGVSHVIFGDLFLEDLREYREKNLAKIGMEAIFPLWMIDTSELSREVIEKGLKANIVTVDPRKVPRELCGSEYNLEFLSKLPEGVDPMGENGEFHSFAWGGPMFSERIEIKVGETVEREGFIYTDLIKVP